MRPHSTNECSLTPLAVARRQGLLGDSNPMVVANAVAALTEIAEVSGKDVLQITRESIKKLLRALNECTEWGQVRRWPGPQTKKKYVLGLP